MWGPLLHPSILPLTAQLLALADRVRVSELLEDDGTIFGPWKRLFSLCQSKGMICHDFHAKAAEHTLECVGRRTKNISQPGK